MVSVDGNNISSNALDKASKVGNISQEQDSEQQKLEIRKAAAQNISIAYDNAINTLKQYQDNQGILNAGFYREKLGQFLKNNNITDIKLCCDTAIKTLEQEKEFATNRLEYVANHEGDFKREFKEFTGKEYDEDAMKEFLVNASNGEDWAASYEKAYNVEKIDKNGNVSYENKIVNNALKKVKYQEYIDGAADIVIMLLGTGLISKGLGKGVGAIGKKLSPHIPKVLKNISAKGLMKVGGNKVTVGAVLGAMAMQSATFSIWDASKNYINLKTKDIQLSGEDAANEWAAYKQGNVESAKFGAFAGLLSSTVVGKVVAGTTKLLEKPVSQAVTKNLAKTLDKSSSLTGKDIMQTFLTKQGPGVVANSAGMLAEISGFTMYETANEVTKELLKKDENGERHLPKDLTEEGLAKYLWKHFKGQATNLAEIKAISRLIFMHKGTADIRNNIIKDNLSKCETLNNIKVEKKTDNGKTSFELTMPDGSKSNVLTMEEVIAKCNVIMQFDMASNIKPSMNNEESVISDNEQTPQDFDPTKTVLSATVRHDGESVTGHSSKNNISTRLQNAITRSDFVAIRNEILKMPDSPEKRNLAELYLKTYQDWSTRRINGNDPNQYTDKPNMAVKNMAEVDVKNETFKSEEELKKYLDNRKDLKDYKKSQIMELYKQYPKEVSALLKEKRISDGKEMPRFDDEEISQLAPVMNKYPEEVSVLLKEKDVDSKGKEVPRFGRYSISELAPVMNKYPEEVSVLLKEKMINSDGKEVPRFYTPAINELAPAMKEYPKEVLTLSREKMINSDGKEVPRFEHYDINELAPVMNKYPEEVSTLINEKDVDSNGKEQPIFDSEEIIKLAPIMNEYPVEVSTLLKEKRISDGKEMPRFDDEEISQLAPVMNKYPEEVSALINENVNFDGIERLRFDGKEISQLAPVMNKYPEEVSALINENVNFDGIEMARYNGNGISLLAPVMNKYPEEVSALINENVNSYGVETPKFRAKDISQLAPIKDFDLESAREQISKQLEIVKANPEKYINGEYPNEQEMLDDIDWFFNKYDKEFLKASAVFDKEALNHLLRMRFDDASEYLDTLNDLPDLNLLKQLSNSTNIDDKPFMPTQKVEFIDLLNAYKENNLETTKIEQMVQEGKIDLAQLNIDLFNKIMKNSGLTDDEIASIPKEKLIAWDTKYAHLLSKEIAEEEDPAFSDLLRAANLEPDFNKYIHDTNNPYGQANAKTKAMYQENNMNYEAWIKPSKENEVHFVSKDKNTEQLNQIASQIAEDINTLMKTPVKGFLKKQYAAKFFKGDEFVIPQEYLTSKSKLTELVKQLSDTSEQGQLTQVWKRAKGNSTNPDQNRAQTARKTLTILDHLNQRIDDLSKVQDGKATKTLDLTIKMWDRNPQKDIFQGNYSTCCIGMGGGNGSAMPYYIMDTAYNMIELVDNTTGKTIGNALCYMVKGENGKPSFIVDNIEINNSEKPSDEVGKQIRSSITEYASKIAKDVTGSDKVPIYLGGQYNDVLIDDLPTSTEKVQFIGDVNREDIYMDLYTDWIDKDEFTKPYQVEQWKLK